MQKEKKEEILRVVKYVLFSASAGVIQTLAFTLLNEIVNAGVSVLCFSSDLPELITLSDRIAVMNGGRIAGVIDCDDISENSVMQLAAVDVVEKGA